MMHAIVLSHTTYRQYLFAHARGHEPSCDCRTSGSFHTLRMQLCPIVIIISIHIVLGDSVCFQVFGMPHTAHECIPFVAIIMPPCSRVWSSLASLLCVCVFVCLVGIVDRS